MKTPDASYVEIGGCRVLYQEVGQGPTVLCLHGGGPGASSWSNFFRNAEELSRHFRLVMMDYPGFGGSSADGKIERPLEFFADVVLGLMDHLQIARASFIGNSTGGGVSLNVALKAPERVDRLILMGSAGYGINIMTPAPTEGVRQIRGYYPEPTIEKMRNLVRAFVYDADRPLFEEVVHERYEASLAPGLSEAALNRGGHSSLVPDLPRIQAPTLLIWGREDRFVPLEHALGFLAGIRNSRLIVLPRCGHWVMAERPAEFNKYVIDFLSDRSLEE